MKEFISIKEAAKILGCSRTWVNELIKRKTFDVYKKPHSDKELKFEDVLDYMRPQKVKL